MCWVFLPWLVPGLVFRVQPLGLVLWGTWSGARRGRYSHPNRSKGQPTSPTNVVGPEQIQLVSGLLMLALLSPCGCLLGLASSHHVVVLLLLAHARPCARDANRRGWCPVRAVNPTPRAELSATKGAARIAPVPCERAGGKRSYRLPPACAPTVHLRTRRKLWAPPEDSDMTVVPRRTAALGTCVGLPVIFYGGRTACVPGYTFFSASFAGLRDPLRALARVPGC